MSMATGTDAKKVPALLQFARLPRWGKVKTRLASGSSDGKALYVHCLLMRHMVTKLSGQMGYQFQLWYDNQPSADDWLVEELTHLSCPIHAQLGNNLGDRMYHALQTTLIDADKVCLIGSDCPDISPDLIRESFQRLEHFDVCIVPALDGGFVLIACKRIHEDMFEGVHWGDIETLRQTCQALNTVDLSYTLLDPLTDIDTLEDLRHWVDVNSTVEIDRALKEQLDRI